MVRFRLAVLAACAVSASAMISIASCAVDPYLTCGAPCAEAGIDGDLPDASNGDAPADADDGGSSFDGFPDAPVCDAASSCLGAGVPSGWTPIDFATAPNLPPCPQGFATTDLVYNVGVPSAACHCTACNPSGAWTCNTEIGTQGNSCNFFDYDASTSACIGFGGLQRTSAQLNTPTRSGSPTCGTSTEDGTGKPSASGARICTPSNCGESVCGQGVFKACIFSAGVTQCPSGYTATTLVGSAASVTCTACPTCSVTNPTATCQPSLSLYQALACAGTASQTLTPADGCTTGLQFMSVRFDSGAPTPICNYGGGNVSGSATLTNPATICCP